MKKILCYIFLLVFSFKSFGFEISRDTPLIKDAAAQVDYLFNRNDEIERTGSEEKKWYIYFLGENAETLKYIIEDSSYKSFSDDYLNQLNNLLTEINTSSGVVMYVGLTDYTKPIMLPFFPDGGTILEKIEALRSRLDEAQNIQEASESDINIGVEYLKKFKKTFGEIVDRIYEESVLPELGSKDYILPVSVYHNITVNKFSKNYHSIVVKRSDVLKEKDTEFQVLRKSNTPPFGSSNDERTIANITDSYQKILSGNYELPIADVPIKKPFELTLCDYLPENNTVDEYGVTEAIKKLNAAHQRRSAITDTETPRSKGDFYHLINVSEGDLSGKAEVIEDKLYLLKQKTGVNFYVVFQPVATKMNIDVREEFAKQVLEGSDLKGSGNTVLITVPFLDVLPTGSLSPISCIQPGFVQGSSSLITSQSFKEASDLFNYVLWAFAEIEKPLFVKRYFLKANGELVNYEVKTQNGKGLRGYPYINQIEFYKSPKLDAIKLIQETIRQTNPDNNPEYDLVAFKEIRQKWVIKLNEMFVQAENEESNAFNANNLNFWKEEEIEIGKLREFYCKDPNIANSYVASNIKGSYLESWNILFAKSNIEPEHLYDFDVWSVVDQTVYNTVDAISLIPKVDVFADLTGTIYAGFRGDLENQVIYSASLAIPFVGAIYLKQARNTDEYYAIIAKSVDDNIDFEVKKVTEINTGELQVSTILTSNREIAEKIVREDIEKHIDKDGIRRLIIGRGKLVENLTGTLKTVYDDLINLGLKTEEKANTILFKNAKNETVATLFEGKFTPTKWKDRNRARDYSQQITEEGYIILKKGDDIAFDLGFKEGRRLKAEEVNDYLVNSLRAQREGQPYLNGSLVEEIELNAGEKFYVVEYENVVKGKPTPNPGGFGTREPISTIEELREKLAVLEQWKDPTKGTLVIRQYEVIKPIRSRTGIIGPQLEKTGINTGKIYPGGTHQYEFYDYLGGENWREYTKCIDFKGTKLK